MHAYMYAGVYMIHMYMYVCICICVYVCLYVYIICVYVYTYISGFVLLPDLTLSGGLEGSSWIAMQKGKGVLGEPGKPKAKDDFGWRFVCMERMHHVNQ